MQKLWPRTVFFFSSFTACFIMSLASGCASGGFNLTRQYAGWVNSQNIVLRIVLYILTSVVFAVTLLLDLVIFNTIDFWDGKISAGTYHFKEGDKNFDVHHEVVAATHLKRSTIEVRDPHGALLQTVILSETASGQIELFVDGVLRTRVRGISSLPIATIFDTHGKQTAENMIFFPAVPSAIAINR